MNTQDLLIRNRVSLRKIISWDHVSRRTVAWVSHTHTHTQMVLWCILITHSSLNSTRVSDSDTKLHCATGNMIDCKINVIRQYLIYVEE